MRLAAFFVFLSSDFRDSKADMADKDKTAVARDIVTTCTKCKMELRHVVISQNSKGVVAKVRCYTCGSEHKYYPEKKHPSTRKKPGTFEKYATLLEQNSNKEAISYSMQKSYQLHDVIEHKAFGKGIVTSVSDQKMDVMFETGPRILACAR